MSERLTRIYDVMIYYVHSTMLVLR